MIPGVPPSADLMTERRRHARRLAVKELIGVQLGAGNRGIVVDLSESGMRVQAASRVELLPSNLLRFEIPGCASPVEASCEVAWADDFGKAGLRFTGLSGESLQDLRRWLREATAPVLVERREKVQPPARPLPLPIPKPEVVTAPSYPVARATEEPGEDARPTEAETFEGRLQAMAQNLMKVTAAEGAIVALRRGGQIVCRASVGQAPPVGTPVQQDSGLAGECVRTRLVIWCRDTNEDGRVNREVCQRLGVRCTVLAPVLRAGSVAGLLEIFSSKPDVFDNGDVVAMGRMAEIVAGLAEKEKAEATQRTAEAGRPTKEAALRLPQPNNGVLVCDACGHRNPDYVRDCENCDVPLKVPELEALLEKARRT